METLSYREAEGLRIIFTQLNLWKKKEDLVREFSEKNSPHLHELTPLEAEKLMCYLLELDEKADHCRKKLLSIGYQLHWDEPRTPAERMMDRKRVNFNHVDEWCRGTHSIYKKGLNYMTPFELTDTVTQLKKVLEHTHGQIRKQA